MILTQKNPEYLIPATGLKIMVEIGKEYLFMNT